MNRMNPKVDGYLRKAKKWREEFKKLRMIILDCQLTEEVKWRQPCYTFEKRNIVLIHGFKEYCALLFFKGALLTDAKGILVQQTENVQAGRQIRFTNVREIVEMERIVKAYIHEAIEVEKTGLKVNLKKTTDFKIPEEFQNKLNEVPPLKTAFHALRQDGREDTFFTFQHPNNPKLGSQGLKNMCSKFSMEKDWMIRNGTKRSISRWIHTIFSNSDTRLYL